MLDFSYFIKGKAAITISLNSIDSMLDLNILPESHVVIGIDPVIYNHERV